MDSFTLFWKNVFNFFRMLVQDFGWYNFETAQSDRLQRAIDCKNVFFLCSIWAQIWGFNKDLNSIDRLPLLRAHEKLGTSWKTYAHLYQIGVDEKFARYWDSDAAKNKEKYGNLQTPPLYSLANMKVRTALIYGAQDNPKDVLWLRDEVASNLFTVVYASSHNLDRLGFTLSREMGWFNKVDEVIRTFSSTSNFVKRIDMPSIKELNGKVGPAKPDASTQK